MEVLQAWKRENVSRNNVPACTDAGDHTPNMIIKRHENVHSLTHHGKYVWAETCTKVEQVCCTMNPNQIYLSLLI